MCTDFLIDGDPSHIGWINTALSYLPDEVIDNEGANIAIIGLGGIGGCRLPQSYREREVVLISDWLFPPVGQSEGDEAGQFFIITVLHEIAHAILNHRSPALDNLTPQENEAQENEADNLAIDWFNQYIRLRNHQFLEEVTVEQFRNIVNWYAPLATDAEDFKLHWHQNRGTYLTDN